MLHDCKLRLTNVKRLRDEAEQTCGDLLSWLGLKGDSQDAHDIIQAIVDFGRRYVTIFKEMYPPQYRPKKTITHKISNQELSSKRSPSATRNKNNALSPGWSARPKISSPLKISRQQIQCNRLRGKSINSILKAHVNSLPGSPKEDQPMMSTTDMEILMTWFWLLESMCCEATNKESCSPATWQDMYIVWYGCILFVINAHDLNCTLFTLPASIQF